MKRVREPAEMSARTKSSKTKSSKPIEEACPICCDTYTKVKRPAIECPLAACDFKACKACVMKYLSEDTYDAPHCMKCREPWLNSFVQSVCTKTFWKGAFRDHMQRLVMDRERNVLPQSQTWVAHYKRWRTSKDRHEESHKKILELKRQLREAEGVWRKSMNEEARLLRDMQTGQRRLVETEDGRFIDAGDQGDDGSKDHKPAVTMGCPEDGCRGFVGERSQCGVCNVFVCAKCRKTKAAYVDEDHECKEEDVKSVGFLKKDSKPCPNCAAPIHRISGCSHMWCTACHTAFCWNSLRVLNAARTHNPHMAQWLMHNAGQLGDAARRRMGLNRADYNTFQNFRAILQRDPKTGILTQAWTLRNHFAHLITRIRAPLANNGTLRMARLAYLTGELDAKEWEAKVRRFDLARQRIEAKTQLFETYITGMDGVNCRITTAGASKIDTVTLMKDLEELRTFFNESWMAAYEAGDIGSVKRQISPTFHWYRMACKCGGARYCYACGRD